MSLCAALLLDSLVLLSLEIVARPLVFVTVLWAVSAAFLPRGSAGHRWRSQPPFLPRDLMLHDASFNLPHRQGDSRAQRSGASVCQPPRRGRAGLCGLQSVVVFI